mmetsp:Transcript_28507/g.72143  ORF Transcript_28507/g.72143 Transcript_28507/m.72143 type:complete len:214 (-) Transcript_28507:424-1065(-)
MGSGTAAAERGGGGGRGGVSCCVRRGGECEAGIQIQSPGKGHQDAAGPADVQEIRDLCGAARLHPRTQQFVQGQVSGGGRARVPPLPGRHWHPPAGVGACRRNPSHGAANAVREQGLQDLDGPLDRRGTPAGRGRPSPPPQARSGGARPLPSAQLRQQGENRLRHGARAHLRHLHRGARARRLRRGGRHGGRRPQGLLGVSKGRKEAPADVQA